MQCLHGIWAPYILGGILLLVAFVWTALAAARTKKSISRILATALDDVFIISGHPVAHWLEEINRDGKCPLIARWSCVISYHGYDYFLVDGSVVYVTLGRFGALRGQSKVWCLVAVGAEAASVLSSDRRLFRRLNGTDTVSAFAIRRLFSFADTLRR